MTSGTLSLVIVDDQMIVRSGLTLVLEAYDDLRVVGEAADGAAGVDMVAALRPDVVLMDVRMPGMDGITATRKVRELPLPRPSAVLILTTFAVEEYLFEALRAGASGFVLKDSPPEELAGAIRAVAAGNGYISPTMTRGLIDAFVSGAVRPPDMERVAHLTEREREVLGLIARGFGNAQIAQVLVVEESTVKTHVQNVLRKLEVQTRTQAAIVAHEIGLVRPASPED